MSKDCELYLSDLSKEIRTLALAAKEKCKSSKTKEDEMFNYGYLSGFQCVVDLMQQMSIGFDINLNDLSPDKIDPYEDLI